MTKLTHPFATGVMSEDCNCTVLHTALKTKQSDNNQCLAFLISKHKYIQNTRKQLFELSYHNHNHTINTTGYAFITYFFFVVARIIYATHSYELCILQCDWVLMTFSFVDLVFSGNNVSHRPRCHHDEIISPHTIQVFLERWIRKKTELYNWKVYFILSNLISSCVLPLSTLENGWSEWQSLSKGFFILSVFGSLPLAQVDI